jgi:hypothetical protein
MRTAIAFVLACVLAAGAMACGGDDASLASKDGGGLDANADVLEPSDGSANEGGSESSLDAGGEGGDAAPPAPGESDGRRTYVCASLH